MEAGLRRNAAGRCVIIDKNGKSPPTGSRLVRICRSGTNGDCTRLIPLESAAHLIVRRYWMMIVALTVCDVPPVRLKTTGTV
jgi:hypothetical protein